MKRHITTLLVAVITLAVRCQICAQGTAFTYQGRLNDGPSPANGHYDFQFILFNVSQFGFPVGPILTNANTSVNNGLFTAVLDFGPNVFMGSNYWLEIGVRTNTIGVFTTLVPRQAITPTPYAVFAQSVGTGGIASGTYSNAVTFNSPANSFSGTFLGNGAGVSNVNATTLGGLSSSNFWKTSGNTDVNPTNGNFIGTIDNVPFDVRVNNTRVMRYRLGTDLTGHYLDAPNVVGGYSGNSAPATIIGATIGGGGAYSSFPISDLPNKVTESFGTVSGGKGNTASGEDATVGGGVNNTASGAAATVPGGQGNSASSYWTFAAGLLAHANHQGTFVWADSLFVDFTSTAANQFLIRAAGGVGINNNSPQAPLHVTGGGDAGLGTGGNIISGLVSGQNLVIDNNEIISRNNGAASDLILNFGSGNVGIGRTPGANRLEVAGEASKATAGNWLANSDARIKTSVQTVTNALDKLSRVRLVQFRYTDDYRAKHPEIKDREYLNVVAQEFQKVFPENVKSSGEKLANGEDILQVDTYPLTIYSAAAVQELNQKLDKLAAESNEKDGRINALEKEVTELKAVMKKIALTGRQNEMAHAPL